MGTVNRSKAGVMSLVVAILCSNTLGAMDDRVATVLMMPGCANGPQAIARIKELSNKAALKVRVQEIVVATEDEAKKQQFLGSPTIRIGGRDIDPKARGLSSYVLT